MLRLRRARRPARAASRSSVCGEMAADPVLLTLLVGLGLRGVQHDADRDPARQAGRCAACASPTRARLRGRALQARPRPTSKSTLVDFCAARQMTMKQLVTRIAIVSHGSKER